MTVFVKCLCRLTSRSLQGEAEQQLRDIFLEASRRAPCCILVDNMDLLCCQRSRPGVSDLQKRIVSCMLSLIDGLGGGVGDAARPVFLVGTTTKPSDIDPAIRRAGRIDREIELGVPSAAERESILLALLQEASVTVTARGERPADKPHSFCTSAELVRDIARLAHGMVGADLVLVLKEAFYLAMRRRMTAAATPSPAPSLAPPVIEPAPESGSLNLALEFESLSLEGEEEDEKEVVASSEGAAVEQVAAAAPQVFSTAPLVDRDLLTDQDFREALSRVSPSALREVVVEVPTVRWGDIGGMAAVKQALREARRCVAKCHLSKCVCCRWWSGRSSAPICFPLLASPRPRGSCCTARPAARRP